MIKYILVAIYILFTVSGVILMKKGGNPGNLAIANNNLTFGINIISLLGLCCYIISFILYTRIVGMFDLSYITPIVTGIVQILTLVFSILILKEQVSKLGLVGIMLVVAGIIIMNLKSQGR